MSTLSTLVGIRLCPTFAAVVLLPNRSIRRPKAYPMPQVLNLSAVAFARACHLPPYTPLRKSCTPDCPPLPSYIGSELWTELTVRAMVEPGDENIRTMRGVCGCRVAHPSAVSGRLRARDSTVTIRR